MAVIPKVLGFAKKVGIGVEGTATKFWTNVDTNVNHWDVDRTVKEMEEIAKDTGQRLKGVADAVAEKIKNKEAIRDAYSSKLKEARTGGNASAKEAATGGGEPNVVEQAVKNSGVRFNTSNGETVERRLNPDFNPKAEIDGLNQKYIYTKSGNEISQEAFKAMTNAHVKSGGTIDRFTEENLKTATEIAEAKAGGSSGIFNTIGGMVQDHPFISAGIAGGAGVLGANLFDDDSGYDDSGY